VSLSIAGVLGGVQDARILLRSADASERHLALAVASQKGNIEIVRLLLDAGEDPNRYNPMGSHSHSTPLHQAALYGHEDVVRLLIERGASVHTKDLLWRGTPADWAKHEGRTEMEALLRKYELKSRDLNEGG
jgi:ankyrin repeat protein